MAILSKVYIIVCLLLNVLMCQWQEHPVYSLNKHHPEAMAMAKHPRSYGWEDYNPVRSSQVGVPICPAEDPNDMRFETHPNVKLNWRNIVKDEDDGENLDIAADGADDDDDDEGDEGDSGTGMDDTTGDDPAFVARVSCLMSALDHHIKAIVCNVNNIGSHLASLKRTGICDKPHEAREPQHESKCPKKTKYFQEKQKDNQDDFHRASGQNPDSGFTHAPFHVPFHANNMGEVPHGSGIHSQNGAEISRTGSQIHFQNRGDISLPRSEIHFQNRGDLTPPRSGIHFPHGADISPPASGIHFQHGGDTNSLPGVGAVSPRISDLKIIYPLPGSFNHEPYEEYETKLRRLMANRDAIEKNVMRMLAPMQGERM